MPSGNRLFRDAVQLAGAASCSIHAEPFTGTRYSARNQSTSGARFAAVSTKSTRATSSRSPVRPAAQYVCYWPQDSDVAGESQFVDLVDLLRVLIPSSWLTKQSIEADERSGAQMTVWSAKDSRNRSAIALYLIGGSVGLHISADR